MIGNGLGSAPVADNDKYKSVTAAVHIKPIDNMRIGISYYHDIVSKGAEVEGKTNKLAGNTAINYRFICLFR